MVTTSPSAMRTTVAVSGSCRRPEKTQAPADFISWFEDLDLLPGLLHLLLGHLGGLAVDAVDGQQVLGHGGPPWLGRAHPASRPNYEPAPPRLTRGPKKNVAPIDR